MRRAVLLPIAVGAIAGAMTTASAASLTVTSKDLTVLSVSATPPPTGDTVAPTPTGLVALNGPASSGESGDGKAEPGDTIEVTFSEPLDASTVCATWPSSPSSDQTATVTVALVNGAGTARDKVTITGCSVGEILLGSGGYTNTGGAAFGSSTLTWSPTTNKLTLVLGAVTSGTALKETNAVSSNVYTPAPAIKDPAGNSITGTASVTDPKFF